jgi:hypothetical protein
MAWARLEWRSTGDVISHETAPRGEVRVNSATLLFVDRPATNDASNTPRVYSLSPGRLYSAILALRSALSACSLGDDLPLL